MNEVLFGLLLFCTFSKRQLLENGSIIFNRVFLLMI